MHEASLGIHVCEFGYRSNPLQTPELGECLLNTFITNTNLCNYCEDEHPSHTPTVSFVS